MAGGVIEDSEEYLRIVFPGCFVDDHQAAENERAREKERHERKAIWITEKVLLRPHGVRDGR